MILSENAEAGSQAIGITLCANCGSGVAGAACPSQSIPAKVIEESVLEQVRKNCQNWERRHQQEHVGERLNRLVEAREATTARRAGVNAKTFGQPLVWMRPVLTLHPGPGGENRKQVAEGGAF